MLLKKLGKTPNLYLQASYGSQLKHNVLIISYEPAPPLFVLQGAPSVRVSQRPIQRGFSAAYAHYRAFSPIINRGTAPTSLRLRREGGGGGRRPGSRCERRGDEPVQVLQAEDHRESGFTKGGAGGQEERDESRRGEAGKRGAESVNNCGKLCDKINVTPIKSLSTV